MFLGILYTWYVYVVMMNMIEEIKDADIKGINYFLTYHYHLTIIFKMIGKFFTALETNFEIYHFSDILHYSLEIYNQACTQNKKIDFEDLLQLQCTIKNGCTMFITQDKGIHKLNVQDMKICSLDTVS
jgi:predicted nucleic-acid-binding protein